MFTIPGIATVPRPSTRSHPSGGALGGEPLPTQAITPSSIRIEPPAISVPSSSIVTTTSHPSIRIAEVMASPVRFRRAAASATASKIFW